MLLVRTLTATCAILVHSAFVLAGSRAWEAQLTHRPAAARHVFSVDVAGHAVANATAEAHLASRYLTIVPQSGVSPYKVWPDSTISFCFDTQSAREKLLPSLKEAMELWRASGAGLPREKYKMVEAFPPGTSNCVNNPQRYKLLVISYNPDGKLATTVGMRGLDGRDPLYKGPTMALSDKPGVGLLDTVANYAHEIGHSWGLYHEHQNQHFWGQPYIQEFTGSVFGAQFKCEALADYEKAMNWVRKNRPDLVDQICVYRGAASLANFSAAEWLPITSMTRSHASSPGQGTYDDVDWDSIMLYPSGAGGSGTAAGPDTPGGLVRDNRANVLLRNDGIKLKINLVPSPLDIQGIRKLYETGLDGTVFPGMPVLPNLPQSQFYARFREITRRNCPGLGEPF
ncbi:hypothetical protein SEUCBS139899_000177 [Sporothrix eucalyptigena]|uniref:Uncharacterized protein n=1 Tax=Sporothrix eucalyptigena TaxID=1812306 RepID=A0ABP0C632_9PEZI